MELISESLEATRLGKPVQFKNLTMLPLVAEGGRDGDYVTLDEALEAGTARVTEVSGSGSVPELKFVNEGDRPVLLLDGEELVGAKQDRILNLTILAPPNDSIMIPVSCVEVGRWSYRSSRFGSAKHTMHARGRAAKADQVSMSARTSGNRFSNQSAIWDDLGAKASRLGVTSPTGAMDGLYQGHESTIEDFVQNLNSAEGQVGAVFLINAAVAGLDLFESRVTLAKLLPKLVRSYALDALDSPTSAESSGPAERANRFLAVVSSTQAQLFPAVGLGKDARLTSPLVSGGALILDDRVVHMAAFPKA